MSKDQYIYLVDLPLSLHIPSLHTFIIHAGILPVNPLKSVSDPSQPLVIADETDSVSSEAARLKEELSLMFDIPQNNDPWTLINMRSVYTKGKKKGQITKSTKKGTPWSEIWQSEMSRCIGKGSHLDETDDHDLSEDITGEGKSTSRKGKGKGKHGELECSPVTVIYGHAAARGLDIKFFSKGIDTGCVVSLFMLPRGATHRTLTDMPVVRAFINRFGPGRHLRTERRCRVVRSSRRAFG